MRKDLFIAENWIQTGKLTALCNSPSLSKQIIKWRNDDIEKGWAGLIYQTSLNYDQLKATALPDSIRQAVEAANSLTDDDINLSYALQIQASLPFFDIDIPNYPTQTKYNQHGKPILQTLIAPLLIFDPNLIIESFKIFCPTWIFSYQYDKDTLVFEIDKANHAELKWYLVASYNEDSEVWQLYVLLAKGLNKNSNLSDIVFWDITMAGALPDDINIFKAELSYYYQYFERYISWIQPQIMDLFNGAENDGK